ncbi:MAG: mechanosensitive ion channel family protein [Candidatus Methanofastidiosia archaeon]
MNNFGIDLHSIEEFIHNLAPRLMLAAIVLLLGWIAGNVVSKHVSGMLRRL